ncbi:MAG: glycosyltransferase family 2 protein [Pirellulales bacterium]
MEPSVSVFLPVCNVQSALEAQVERVLDILPELTDRFDVLIIDDGSTDETMDIARELAVRYPQVGAVRHAERLGTAEAIQTGLSYAAGDVVLVHSGEGAIDPEELLKVWQRDIELQTEGRRGSLPAELSNCPLHSPDGSAGSKVSAATLPRKASRQTARR